MINKVNPQKEFKHYKIAPIQRVCQLSEIVSFRETNKALFRSESVDRSKFEFYIEGKHKKERKIDLTTVNFDSERNKIRMNVTQGIK